MNRTPVLSSNIASVGHDAATSTLEVEFLSGSLYQYFDVPETVFQELVTASSVGSFLAREIKGQYRYAQL